MINDEDKTKIISYKNKKNVKNIERKEILENKLLI